MSSRTLRELTALRRASQLLGERTDRTPADVVRWMLAMQGQDFPGAVSYTHLDVYKRQDRGGPANTGDDEVVARLGVVG